MGQSIFDEMGMNQFGNFNRFSQPAQSAPQQHQQSVNQFRNLTPMEKARAVIQAMQNPVAFVKAQFPGIPNDVANSPTQVLNYMRQQYGVTDQQIQEAQNMANQIPGIGTVK